MPYSHFNANKKTKIINLGKFIFTLDKVIIQHYL